MNRPLRPILTLADVYGPRRVYAPRAHPMTCDWISRDAMLLDALTGNQLCVAGAMPVVCSAGSVVPAATDLLAESGIAPAASPLIYRGAVEALGQVARAAAGGAKVVLQHAYPPGALPPEAQWIDPQLLAYLNNKANLAELVPAPHVPRRMVRPRDALFAGPDRPKPPVVFKCATNLSTGGGAAVAVCRTDLDIADAARTFDHCADVVVEEYLSIARNPCLHYAAMSDGTVRYLGFADQDITDAGRYRGNWIALGEELPERIVDLGLVAARRGADLGYRGFIGIDVAMLDDGRALVLDLNFRVNGSTAPILLAPAILDAFGQGTLHFRTFTAQCSFDDMIRAARATRQGDRLFLLAAFDPTAAGHPGAPPRLVALVRAESQNQVLAIEAELATLGLH